MTQGVLVMAYGTPGSPDELEAYYTDIRRGRPPSAEALEELRARYDAIGGRSPLAEISRAQAAGIAERTGAFVSLGFKHAAPSIADAVGALDSAGIETAVGLVLAPHYSTMSIGDYAARAERAAASIGWAGRLDMVESWHLEPGFIDLLADEVRAALGRIDTTPEGAEVIFSAHSLPARIVTGGDPYPEQLRGTAMAVADKAGLPRWRTAWQSAGRTDEDWLGPDLLDVLKDVASTETHDVIVCPCGFVADHLEVLYDVDIEAASAAEALGLRFARTASPNDDPRFLDVLADVVGRRIASG